ncbi:MAG: cytochrome c oxidase subunit II [Candidatus Baltobacteraceae bacterium]
MPVFDPASVQGSDLSGVWKIFIAAGLAVAVFVYALIAFAMIKWRRRADDDGSLPPQFDKNPFWEVTGTVIPLLIVGGLFAITLVREYHVDALEKAPYATVDVTGYRWSWRFSYPGHNIVVDGTAYRAPTLVVPEGKLTQINLNSADVIHAFWIPAFLFKRDATPGYTMHFDLSPSRSGTFDGVCAEFCGLQHGLMTFHVRVVPPAQYTRWLASGGTVALR